MKVRAFTALASLVACGTGPGPGPDETDETDESASTDETDESASTDETDETEDTVSTDETDVVVPTDPCMRDPGSLVIATGAEWEDVSPLVSGQPLEMVKGDQAGGYHLDLALHATNVNKLAILELRVVDVASETAVLADDPIMANVELVPLTGPGTPWACSGVYTLKGIFDFGTLGADAEGDAPWSLLCGHEVRIELSLRDPDGVRPLSQSIHVVVQPDPVSGPHCTGS